MFTLDTNILIYYCAGDKDVVSFLDKNQEEIFYLPSIVILEFLSFPLISQESITKFRLFASQTTIINLDFFLAERTAEIRRVFNLKLADAIVAAAAFFTNSTLVTRNIQDFKKIKELRIIKI